MDISDEAINRMLKIAHAHTQKVVLANNTNYSNEQIEAFNRGSLF